MKTFVRRFPPLLLSAVGCAVATVLIAAPVTASSAHAEEAPLAAVDLGTASSFAVLAGSTVTNTGPSVVSGDLGVSPKTAVTGFPPGQVNNGTIHAADAVALQAQSDLTTAYVDAAGRLPTGNIPADLGGMILTPGVYNGGALSLTGTVTLNGDANSVFIFQAASSLTTASNSTVSLIGGATECNVFWQVTSAATLGTGSHFVGTVMALTSVTATTGVTVNGRLLARNGAVTLDSNVINRSQACAASDATGGTGGTGSEVVPGPDTVVTPVVDSAPVVGSTPVVSSAPLVDSAIEHASGGEALASTGTDTAPSLLAALALFGTGSLLLVWHQRRAASARRRRG